MCGRRCPAYDHGDGRRRWRALDIGTLKAHLKADTPQVRCTNHRVVVGQVSRARHGAGQTYAFDDTAAWLATNDSKSPVRPVLCIVWEMLGAIATSVVAAVEEAALGLLSGERLLSLADQPGSEEPGGASQGAHDLRDVPPREREPLQLGN
jgi:transposase